MTMTRRAPLALASVLALALPAAAMAQSLDYGSVDGDDAPSAKSGKERGGKHQGRRGQRDYGVTVSPYIEAAQIVTAELQPGDEVLTYSRLTAGLDADIQGRYNAASVSVRYDRYFGWGKKAGDGDVVSGVARGYATVTPGLQVEAGALATRSKIDGEGIGSGLGGGIGSSVDGGTGNVYSVYAGPTIKTQSGPVQFDAAYRIGYTKVETDDDTVIVPGGAAVDVFDESVTHNAEVHAGVAPGDVLPVGLGVGGGFYREDVSNLDQRIQDMHARADVTLPIGQDVALVGGIGYEDVEISSRDALRDANGVPVVGSDGRYVTDKSGPRVLAYDVNGIIWDAGVVWKPSRRTQLEAHVGKRYGTTSYYGSFSYAPNSRVSVNVAVYDNVAGFGGQVNRALADLPTNFEVNRNPLTGDINGCVASLEGNNCLGGVLASVRSSTFRARGVAANYNLSLGNITAGFGAGYDRRKFIAAPGTILAASNGVIDENIWMAAYLNAQVSERGTVSTNIYGNRTKSGDGFGATATSLGASAAYGHALTNRLTATAAVGIDGTRRQDPLPDDWEASALAGVRYRF